MNNRIIAIAIAILVVMTSAAAVANVMTSSKDSSNGECYGIIGAMEEEVTELLNAMDETRCEKIGDITFHFGTLCGKEVVVSECGIGKVNAAIVTQLMITEFDATAIINTGVAGTLTAEVGIGHFVISSETVQHDYNLEPIGYPPGYIPNLGTAVIKADEELVKSASEAISQTVGTIVHIGRICTGDQFIAGEEAMKKITDVFGGLCCEMEGGSIAQVCYLNHVPFVIVRAISDDVNGRGPADYDEFMREMAAICANMTMEMLKTL
jgi:adenosylhomocysteine nucleosidase